MTRRERMKRRVGAALALAVLVAAPAAAAERHGVAFVSWSRSAYSTAESDASLKAARRDNADWISLLVTGYMRSSSASAVESRSSTPKAASLAHAVRRAHALGLKVLLKPHVDVDDGSWRGSIAPGDVAQWHGSYEAFIVKYARLAQRVGADEVAIGTELKSTSGDAGWWRRVAARVRARFRGPITYAANHDEADQVAWWDAVDYIGIDAYYPLGSATDVASLVRAWQPYVASIDALHRRFARPVVFTEIGYQSATGATEMPWSTPSRVADLGVQDRAYEAALSVWRGRPWFGGMFWWNWNATGSAPRTDWTPEGKPAEATLARWFGSPRRVSGHRHVLRGRTVERSAAR